MDEPTLTIGQVAARAGINTSAIRYYERVGLLPEPERRSGQRRYTKEAIRRLAVIDVAKRAGFTLDDARALLATSDDGVPAHEQIRELAQRKLPEVEALIERAEAVRRWLTTASGCTSTTSRTAHTTLKKPSRSNSHASADRPGLPRLPGLVLDLLAIAEQVLVCRRSRTGAERFEVALELGCGGVLSSPLLPGFALSIGGCSRWGDALDSIEGLSVPWVPTGPSCVGRRHGGRLPTAGHTAEC